MDFFKFNEGLFAPVDSVHLMQNGQILATGSRDRYLNVIDTSKLNVDDPLSIKDARVHSKLNAHKGWIWTMSSFGSTLATGSWDTKIKFWDLAAPDTCIQEYKAKSAVLCSHYEPGFYVAGSFGKKVYHFDPRTDSVVAVKCYHQQPVLCLVANEQYIVTGSEDKTVVVYDRRAEAILRTLVLSDYAMSMSYNDNQLWIGDKSGFIHLVDATDGAFDVVETYNVGHTGKVTGIAHCLGALFTCSTDKTIKVLEPSRNPGMITTLCPHAADVASLSYQNGILASAGSDVSVGIWKPKQ